MQPFSENTHKNALLRRRIKFVVEKGAMARLFKAGTHSALQEELFLKLKPLKISNLRSKDDYDNWLLKVIENECWDQYSRNGLTDDRWAYFAKLINIVIYEIVGNRELFSESGWRRLRHWLHLPLDSNIFFSLQRLDPKFPATWILKGMTKKQYLAMQNAARNLAKKYSIPPIWFEDAWSS